MSAFLACYDLNDTNDPHQDFMAAAETLGWVPWTKTSSNRWFKLPNTTLKGTFETKDAAVTAFKAIRLAAEKSLGHPITVEKWIVAEYSAATVDSDEVVDD